MPNLAALTAAEVQHLAAVEQVKKDIAEHVKNLRIPGVTPIETNGPVCFTVNLSTVMSTNAMNLSPDFYSSEAQARHVAKAIASCKTATDVNRKLNSILENGFIEINEGYRVRYTMNPVILDALRSFLEDDAKCAQTCGFTD